MVVSFKGKSFKTWLYCGQVICNVIVLYGDHLQRDCVVWLSFMTSYGEVICDYGYYRQVIYDMIALFWSYVKLGWGIMRMFMMA